MNIKYNSETSTKYYQDITNIIKKNIAKTVNKLNQNIE